jgi:hypothetical protein
MVVLSFRGATKNDKDRPVCIRHRAVQGATEMRPSKPNNIDWLTSDAAFGRCSGWGFPSYTLSSSCAANYHGFTAVGVFQGG